MLKIEKLTIREVSIHIMLGLQQDSFINIYQHIEHSILPFVTIGGY